METLYVNKKMIIAINKLSIELSGGTVVSGNNLRPGCSLNFVETIYTNCLFGEKIYADIFYQAAAYMFYIIKNHIFIDGNKRTGLATAITFLNWNNISLKPFEEDDVFQFVIDIAANQKKAENSIESIAIWLKSMHV